jgi:hypothetical protein
MGMIAKRLMWLLVVSSMVVLAGCGGKKAMDEPVTEPA